MFFFQGLTLKEIADRTGETFSNVRHHYYRGLERLRIHLEETKEDTRRREAQKGETKGPAVLDLGEASRAET
jgi:hypothetical protein